MAQHFFNCVPPVIAAIFGNSRLVEVPDRLSNYNFHSFRSSSLGSLQTLDNGQENSSFDLLSLGICGSGAMVNSPVFPSQIWTSAEEKLGRSE